MPPSASENLLDTILATQVTIAWAGEGRCSPRRLGWWDTQDLIDQSGGGDLFARLLPQTYAWASIEAVREAATRTDAKARNKMAAPDRMRTLFFLGFEIDEQLSDRLAFLKRSRAQPFWKHSHYRCPSMASSKGKSLRRYSTRKRVVAFKTVPERARAQGGPTRTRRTFL